MSGIYEGARGIPPEAIGALQPSNRVNAVFGDTALVISRPGDERVLVLQCESGTFRFRPGNYAGEAFAAGDVTTGTDRITVTGHSFTTGDGPYKMTTDTTLPEPFASTPDTLVYVRSIDANTIELYDSAEEALDESGTTGIVDLTTQGVGNHNLGGPAGWAPAALTAAAVTDGYGSGVLGAGASLVLTPPDRLTVVGFSAADALTYWFAE